MSISVHEHSIVHLMQTVMQQLDSPCVIQQLFQPPLYLLGRLS
eukprot:COSAG02_NODE_1025_length_15146_cov_21.959460_7_plen_43_part_00